jgi:hypothetical protein
LGLRVFEAVPHGPETGSLRACSETVVSRLTAPRHGWAWCTCLSDKCACTIKCESLGPWVPCEVSYCPGFRVTSGNCGVVMSGEDAPRPYLESESHRTRNKNKQTNKHAPESPSGHQATSLCNQFLVIPLVMSGEVLNAGRSPRMKNATILVNCSCTSGS